MAWKERDKSAQFSTWDNDDITIHAHKETKIARLCALSANLSYLPKHQRLSRLTPQLTRRNTTKAIKSEKQKKKRYSKKSFKEIANTGSFNKLLNSLSFTEIDTINY